MGISGLLPLLKSIHKPCHVRKFKGQTIGVDAYGWLHRGTVSCAIDLALDRPVTKYVDFAMHRVKMLLHHGVTPYIVFDGDHLPSKAATEIGRAKRREESKKAGLELYRLGKISQAHQELQKAVDVTPYMARLFIEELKKLNIQYIVAPYEADAQLVYLERKGIISGILSEDSDMLVFGAKRLLTKLEQYGDCVEINHVDFTACRDISLIGWTDTDFRRMAILSGCDYLANIKKMGIKTAYRYVRRYKSIEKVLQMLQFEGQFHVPAGYLEDFKQAELTFLHQRVFCPLSKQMSMLTELEEETKEEDLPFIGAPVDQETAIGVACGDLDPMTKEQIIVRHIPGSYHLRRQTVAPDSDLKKIKKPIDEFFKSRRQPLAELDPNSFSLSPTQQRLLENGNTTLNSRPAPSATRTSRSRISLPASRPSPSPLTRSVHRDEWLSRAAIIPEQSLPAKRQRLCSNVEDLVVGEEENSTSKFFPSKDAGASIPNKTPRSKKAKKSGINIWSDDSFDEALALLPDISEPIQPPKMKVFSDGGEKTEPGDSLTVLAENTSQSSTLVSETSVTSNFTADTSVTGSFDGDEYLEEAEPKAREEMLKLAQQFAYGNANKPALSVTRKQLSTLRPSRTSGKVQARTGRMEQEKATLRPSLSQSKSESLLHHEHFASEVHKFASSRAQSATLPLTESPSTPDSSATATKELVSRTPPAEPVRVEELGRVSGGSEDLLVPDSEDEGQEPVSDDDRPTRPALNIGKFLFTPR